MTSSGSDAMVSSLVLRPDETASVRLYGRLGRALFLALGDSVEITLHEAQVRALRGDIDAALDEMEAIDTADLAVVRTSDAGAQAHRAAHLALERAEAADLAGDTMRGLRLREAAAVAASAAGSARTAVEVAERAMAEAEEAMEHVTHVVAHAVTVSDAAAELPSPSA
jgi:hypothetical protein